MGPPLIPDVLIPLIRELGVESMLYLHGALSDPADEATSEGAHQASTSLSEGIAPVSLRRSSDPAEVSSESGLVYLTATAVANPLEGSASGPQEQIIAFCRDHCQGHLWVEATSFPDQVAAQALFFSLGFSVLPGFGKSESSHFRPVIYHYSLHGYKSIPDWLNARYWAHSERWG